MKSRMSILGKKFRKAGSSGTKVHIMANEGHWVIFKEGFDKILAKYPTRQGAIANAKKILNSGLTDMLVFHRPDGTVEKVQPS